MIYLSETVWITKLGKIISDKTYNVWKALYEGLTKYHDLLFERKKLIDETTGLYDRNKELKKLLTSYMNREENDKLIVKPLESIKEDEMRYAMSDLGAPGEQ